MIIADGKPENLQNEDVYILLINCEGFEIDDNRLSVNKKEGSIRIICTSTQYLRKYGRVIKTMATRIIKNMLVTKYGKAHSTTPDRRAIPRR